MKLTKTDLAAIYRACEENCMSIVLFHKLDDFYDDYGNWSEDYETRQNERILALLFFAAAGGEL